MIRRIRSKARRLSTAAIICGAMEVTATRAIAAPPSGTLPNPMPTWVTRGEATYVTSGNSMTINQSTDRAILNWQSFNISSDGKVTFKQPDANSIALNRIFDGNASEIFGSLQANGQVYLINQNGFLFGSTARVNVGGLVASSLNISDDVFKKGLLSATQDSLPTFESAGNMASIIVAPGARIATNAEGQRILLAAKTIDNQGEINANDGQVILAAGEKLYVAASDDPALRGLLVEVDGGAITGQGVVTASVTNTGTVTAERGNITAIGLAINQNGRMTATTSVSKNGSIRLLARDTATLQSNDLGEVTLGANRGGELTLGSNSITAVNTDANDSSKAFAEQVQSPSSIEMVGGTIQFSGGSQVLAAGGQLSVIAASDQAASRDGGVADDAARIRVDSGARIDLSGSTATKSVTNNLVTVELRANELADSPQQRDGALRGQTVVVDARVGTPLANVDAALKLIGQDVLERTSAGGAVTFDSAGDIVVAKDATVDVSGGVVNYTGGVMRTTQLIKTDGSMVDIGKASKDGNYIGLINPVYKLVSDRWGVVQLINAPGLGRYEPGYVQGQDAGSIQFMGNAMSLNGNFIGTVSNGVNQRTPASAAKGGQFIVGTRSPAAASLSFRAPEIELVAKAIPTVVGTNTSLPTDSTLFLTTDFVRNGFTRVQLASDRGITLPKDIPINLESGGSVTLFAPHIDINGDINAAAGQFNANAITPANFAATQPIGLLIGDGVTLDVGGRWINDSLVPPNQQPTEGLFTTGGTISLQQSALNGTLQIGDDVVMHASGGGWMKQSGAVAGGAGGSITIKSNNNNTADQNQTLVLGDHLQLDAFGVQGAKGGSFSLRAPRIEVIEDQQWLTTQQVRSNTNTGGTLKIGSALFSDYGFANFVLQADSHALASDVSKTTLKVATGTHVDLSPASLMLTANAGARVSGSSLADFSTANVLPDFQANAASLSLLATTALANRDAYGGLNVATGASISGSANSTINLATMGNLTFGGAIDVTHGTVNMTIAKSAVDNEQAFVNRQLTLESTASIDVSGAAIFKPNDLGLKQGTVSDGGSVNATVNIGSLNIKNGARIDISGTQAQLDIQSPGSATYATKTVASVGGALILQAAESIVMQGTLDARGGVSSSGENTGGTLNVALTRRLENNGASTFPTDKRVLQLTNGASATPAAGVAALDAASLAASGVDTLRLKADDRIAIGSGVDLRMQRSVTLDAPEIAVLGTGLASINAGYLSVGPVTSKTVAPTAGTGELALQADHIDMIGTVALQTKQATLASTGDINLEGYGTLRGSLVTQGNLTLRGQRILPTTDSSYTINASGSDSTISIEQAGTSPGTPLSVAGSLTIKAANIVQGGTLLAPFGSIELNATKSLQLLPGSYTSVNSNGNVLPYGHVENGDTWISQNTVSAMPQRKITLSGGTVDMASGAVVDLSGGGDLLAYQWTPGTGGKTDALAGDANGMYAIMPALKGQSAPYDPAMWLDSTLTPGQSVYIADGAGVPAGVYQLLPARYALLPGAYLISAVSGYQDLPPGAIAATADGAPVVAGYMSFGNELNGAARYSGFAVRPGSYGRKLAQYNDQFASSFFPAHAEDNSGKVNVPNDAGTLVVAVQQSLNALATVRGQAAANGINATVEITTTGTTPKDIEVQANANSANNGAVQISGSALQGWRIGSLLLGGTRNAAGAIDVKTGGITVRNGATLVADEVVLAASQAINVESGATVSSSSGQQPGLALDEARFADATTLQLTGANANKAAVLAVSDLAYRVTARDVPQPGTGSGIGATVNVASGATVATRGSVVVDAAGVATLASGSVHADRASWSLAAKHISIGDANTATDGLAIDNALLSNLQNARSITLRSAGDLDIHQAAVLGNTTAINELNIKAGRINNLGDTTASSFTANRVVLNGTTTAPTVVAGNGGITFNAQEIELGAGLLGLSGFNSARLNASKTLVGIDTGGITTSGDLNVTSGAITTASGAHTDLRTTGTVQLLTSGAVPTINTLATGGTLNVTGRDIVDSAQILTPSGVVTLDATNSLSLLNGAVIDASGIKPTLAVSGSNGGAITLNSGGALNAAAGTTLNVSGGVGADAGTVAVRASGAADIASQLLGHADSGQTGAEFSVQAQSIANLAGLTQQLASGGFTERQAYRVTGGDLTVAGNSAITARQIELVADSGAITVDGALIAQSDDQRSSIIVNAKNNVAIGSNAVIDASAADAASQRGGSIELATKTGRIQMTVTADVQATGKDQSGSLTLRAPATANDFNLDSLPTDLSHVDSIVLEPIKSYALASATPTAADFNTIRNSLTSYMGGANSTILNRLGLSAATNAYVRPYADLTRVGDLTLPALDLGAASGLWRFAGQPAVLSVRATGNLTIAGTLSDGVTAVNTDLGPGLDILDTAQSGKYSSSFNLVAGSDLNSASNQATVLNSGKDVVLGSNAIMRTGTGDIDVNASRDIVFGAQSSIYTIGLKGAVTVGAPVDPPETPSPFSIDGASVYGDRGGNVNLTAGNDVRGSVVVQAVNDWQTHWSYLTADGKVGVYWGTDLSSFGWNVGTLGGGDVVVSAGRDVRDLSAAVADSASEGATVGSRISLGGGNLSVASGRDIKTGYFYVGKGTGSLRALGALNASGSRTQAGQDLGTFLLAGDAKFKLAATGDVLFQGIMQNSLLFPTRFAEWGIPESFVWFTRYGDQSFIDLQSTGGSVRMAPNDFNAYKQYANFDSDGLFSPDPSSIDLYPATINARAFGGDLVIESTPYASPSAQGNVTLYASRDIVNRGGIRMSDVSSLVKTAEDASLVSDFAVQLQNSGLELVHKSDTTNASIVAGRDIVNLLVNIPKAAEIQSGRDIVDLSLKGQQSGLATTTLVSAGRDVVMTNAADTREISVGGTGALEVLAGRNINLGFSKGAFTTGNLRNGNLIANSGANLIAIAGLSQPLGIDATASQDFIATVVGENPVLQAQLVAFMVEQTGNGNLDFAAASNAFRALPLQQQIPFATDALFGELVASGREALATPGAGFARGYAALASLFPDSQTASNPYVGDVSLPFSRIYTLNGGNIAVLAPGGKIDVGLATTPASLARINASRPASELGIVAQGAGNVNMLADGDVLVNTSRVFTLGGGDIAIWSSKGNIDAGKGAKSAISAPPPTLVVDAAGNVTINFAEAVSGSGIRTISTGSDIKPGNVDLIAPVGFVNAGDAGIGSSGNLNIAAQRVVGLDNIQVGGTSTGVPPETAGLGASLSGVTNAAGNSTNAASNSVTENQSAEKAPTALAESALSWLEVFVVGLGEENCKQDDLECLKRQSNK